jgi:flavin reductase (DIM6/NTAB) family NADH-FMN oxidoreductase RutF/DNA-binding transcriptional regulator YhcF (GntR family)
MPTPVQPPFDSRSFRRVLGSFATGVTVITAVTDDGGHVGMTANSFNSLSLDPALVLWSVARSSALCDIFSKAPRWAIHVLSEDQRDLSTRFASRSPDRFAGLEVEEGLGSVPLLNGCVGVLQCARYAAYDGGDHVILVGRVEAFHHRAGEPLVFHGGKYARLSSAAEHAYHVLRSRIISMEMPPGARFADRDLAGEAGMSATPVREALDRLEAVGLVEADQTGGYQVVPLTRRHAKDSFDMLASLGPSLFSFAVRKCPNETLAKVCADLEAEAHAWKYGRDSRRWMSHCVNVFDFMLEAADNEHHEALWRRMSGINERLWTLAFKRSPEPPGIAIMGDLIAAFRSREHEAVTALVQGLVQATSEQVMSLIDEPGSDPEQVPAARDAAARQQANAKPVAD